MNRDLHPHTAAEWADGGHKLGFRADAAVPHHLRDMLVPLVQGVGSLIGQAGQTGIRVFPLFDQGVAAAGVAGQGVNRHRSVRGQQPGINQRTHQQDKPGRIAAGVGDILGLADGRALARFQLRQTVGPAGGNPVGGAGVNQAGIRLLNPLGNLHRGVIGQAENRHVGLQNLAAAFFRIAPQILGQGQQFHILPRRHPLMNPQAGGAGMAVDKNLGKHNQPLPPVFRILPPKFNAIAINGATLIGSESSASRRRNSPGIIETKSQVAIRE